jgi:uncharacterized membrane protein YphA (DoxX/SURF4 family)
MKLRLPPQFLAALDLIFRLVVAVVFLLAAVPKILDPMDFAKAIANYKVFMPVVGYDYIYPVAIILPALELVAAIALFLPRWKKAGSLICGGMLIMFIVLIGQAVLRGLNIDCGCFGSGAVGKALANKVGISKILEDVAWAGMCAFIYWRTMGSRKRYSLSRESTWS